MAWTPEQCSNMAASMGSMFLKSATGALVWHRLLAGGPVWHRFVTGAVLSMVLMLATGCQMMVNPYHDEMAMAAPVTTPSATGLREANVAPRMVPPYGDPKIVRAASGAIIHSPLYFEDPVDESGSEDGQFAITSEDFYAFWSTGFRFPMNLIFYPLSAVVTPPWMVMESDGATSRKICCGMCDAMPLPSPTG